MRSSLPTFQASGVSCPNWRRKKSEVVRISSVASARKCPASQLRLAIRTAPNDVVMSNVNIMIATSNSMSVNPPVPRDWFILLMAMTGLDDIMS